MASVEHATDAVNCPYCASSRYSFWASERGYNVVRCDDCAFLYLNPRPSAVIRQDAVRSGLHAEGQHNVVDRWRPDRVARYRTILGDMFSDVWREGRPVSWLDVGSGYGEVMEAVTALAPAGSRVVGVEPMLPKAEAAARRGLNVVPNYLENSGFADIRFVSLVNVFSHIPDFDRLLAEIRQSMLPDGEIFIETGNSADLSDRNQFPGELSLPDHLAFAGERHIRGYLERHGFGRVVIRHERIDGPVYAVKTVVKKLIGRDVRPRLPYTSSYRNLLVRASP